MHKEGYFNTTQLSFLMAENYKLVNNGIFFAGTQNLACLLEGKWSLVKAESKFFIYLKYIVNKQKRQWYRMIVARKMRVIISYQSI